MHEITWCSVNKIRHYTYFITEEQEEIRLIPYIEMGDNRSCREYSRWDAVNITIERIFGPLLDTSFVFRFLLYLFLYLIISICNSFLIIEKRYAAINDLIISIAFPEKYVRKSIKK